MHLDYLLYPRQTSDGCVSCPTPAPCNCAANEQCFQISRSCTTCSSNKCVPIDTSGSGSGGGVSKGAVAGAVIGSLLFLCIVVAVFWWWRRRNLVPKQAEAPTAKDVPAPAETVLNRPDPIEKTFPSPTAPREEAGTVRVYSTTSNSIIDLDPESRGASRTAATASPYHSTRDSVQSNPFGDAHSIQTTSTGTHSTNVIPIALVPPGSVGSTPPQSPYGLQQQQQQVAVPMRPDRSPNMELNMDHLNISSDNFTTGEPSVRSGVSAVSSRQSYMSGASYASDVLTEAPTIVMQSQRQVFGIVKAEVVQAPGSSPVSPDSLKAASIASRPPVRSPLAATSFGPQDVLRESEEELSVPTSGDPFGDEHSPVRGDFRSSAATFGTTSDAGSAWTPGVPSHPWSTGDHNSRPISISTQAGSIIGADIRDATRVHLGFVQPMSASFVPPTPVSSSGISGARSLYRMTSGRLVTPPSTDGRMEPLQRQQERAYVGLQANTVDRSSMSTMASGTSTRADSILESFTFVPPSPISNRPLRTPPRSPLGQNAFNDSQPSGSAPVRDGVDNRADSPLVPPNRRQLGLSTGSQMSAMSTGLGSFPFQIDSGNNLQDEAPRMSSEASPSVAGRQRASLDTLALTSDLSSYPLGFDRHSEEGFPFSTKG